MAPIYYDEIAGDDVLIFSSDAGVAINVSKDRLLILSKDHSGWNLAEYTLDDFRSFEVHAPGASEFVTFGRQGIGTAIGVAARNAAENRKARNATGILINLRRTDRPNHFLKIPDNARRAAAAEALRQFCEDGRLREPYQSDEDYTARAWRRPSEKELLVAQDKAATKAKREQAWASSMQPKLKDAPVIIGASAVIAVVVWLIYCLLVWANVGRPADLFDGDIVIFFFCALPVAYLIQTWRKVREITQRSS